MTGGSLPRIVAFDLDATVWYPEMYMLSGAPFKHSVRKDGRQIVIDRAGEEVYLMGDTHAILHELATDPKWADTQASCARVRVRVCGCAWSRVVSGGGA